ncbi:MAG: tRNA (guanosine(37)-N1)-methyltransferase TrmD [Candidatus Spechtbacterales bacterium]
MRFDILTIFPHMMDSYVNESILKRAQEAGHIQIASHDIREYATDKHRTTDDTPYGGGAGMVMKIEPIYKAVVASALSRPKVTKEGVAYAKGTRVVLLSAKGEQFTQAKAYELSKYKQVILICGRYEGVDERVADYIADEEISVGPYVLTGGELPALTIVDAVARLVPGVLGNEESLSEESFSESENWKLKIENWGTEYPQYTRPEVFSPKRGVEWRVPEVLLGGNHAEIEKWRKSR